MIKVSSALKILVLPPFFISMLKINLLGDQAKSYLEGKELNSGISIDLKPHDVISVSRDNYLCKICYFKDIIHFGFVDHISIIDEKIKSDTWLHKKLIYASNCCFGIDINKAGINYLKNILNIENMFCLDIEKDQIPLEIKARHFDYLLLPDVIEHIGNPVNFLRNIHIKFKNNIDKIILTTPNVFKSRNFKEILKGREFINSDHRIWFSPYTISKILADAGFTIDELNFIQETFPEKKNIRFLLKKTLLKRYPWFKADLIIEAKFK